MAMDPRKDSAREVANKERACVWQLAAALLLGFVRIGIRAVDKTLRASLLLRVSLEMT